MDSLISSPSETLKKQPFFALIIRILNTLPSTINLLFEKRSRAKLILLFSQIANLIYVNKKVTIDFKLRPTKACHPLFLPLVWFLSNSIDPYSFNDHSGSFFIFDLLYVLFFYYPFINLIFSNDFSNDFASLIVHIIVCHYEVPEKAERFFLIFFQHCYDLLPLCLKLAKIFPPATSFCLLNS